MGTVGLSFGSPTSGAGFDVNATVSTIVGNLRKVEQPWKDQLAKLQSQDTVLSSVGTLLSSLSKDVSQLTDFTGVMAQKTGSSSDTNILQLTSASSVATAGTHTVTVKNLATTSSGYMTVLPSPDSALTGSITVTVGTGTPYTITLNSNNDTLSGLAAAINSAGIGVIASVLTDTYGSRLSLVSGTSGSGGNLTVDSSKLGSVNNLAMTYTGGSSSSGTLTGIPTVNDTLNGTLTLQVGANAPQTINVDAQDNNNTLTTLMNSINANGALGVTASIVTNSDGTQSLALASQSGEALTVTQSLTDVSSPISYTTAVTGTDAQLTVDGVNLTSGSNTVSNLIPGVTFQLLSSSSKQSDGSLEQIQVIIGNDNTGVETAISQFVKDYNALMAAIQTQQGNDSSGNPEPLFGSPTISLLQQMLVSGVNAQNPNGHLDAISATNGTTFSGSMTIQVGSKAPQTIQVPADNTLAGMADAINSANIGVTAAISTKYGQSIMTLQSLTAGSAGALAVTSSLTATSDTSLGFITTSSDGTSASSATLTSLSNGADILSGSISIQVGNGQAQTITPDPSNKTLQGLADTINATAGIGVTASISSDGKTLSLVSQTAGTAGNLILTSTLLDTTDTKSSAINYINSSDLSTLANLGITVSSNYDGSLQFDANVLDQALNSDFKSVLGFFQSTNSWGQTFANMLNSAGSSSSTGILALASKANTNIEKSMKDNVAKQEVLIAAQQKNLTAQLNRANQILQSIPQQLDGIDQIYSAITGYNRK